MGLAESFQTTHKLLNIAFTLFHLALTVLDCFRQNTLYPMPGPHWFAADNGYTKKGDNSGVSKYNISRYRFQQEFRCLQVSANFRNYKLITMHVLLHLQLNQHCYCHAIRRYMWPGVGVKSGFRIWSSQSSSGTCWLQADSEIAPQFDNEATPIEHCNSVSTETTECQNQFFVY